jgi:hypothetical protein
MVATASWTGQSGRIEPYVSINEVLFSASAAAIDFSNLIENGSDATQRRALYELIVRASAMVDRYTMGQYGTLNATTNTENGRYRPNRYGQVIINPYFTPIIQVTDFKAGYGPGAGLWDIPIDNNTCSIEREQFIVTYSSSVGLQVGPLTIAGGNWAPDTQLFCEWTYINGYANSFTSAQVAAGSTTIELNDTTGLIAGQNVFIWDGVNDEYVTVTAVDNTTVTLANPTLFTHGVGVNVSAIPADVKQAAIHFVIGLVKQRGQGGLVIGETGEPIATTPKAQNSMEDFVMAYDLLHPFRVVWSRS